MVVSVWWVLGGLIAGFLLGWVVRSVRIVGPSGDWPADHQTASTSTRPVLNPGDQGYDELLALIRAGHKIEAIKRCRELYPQMGLKEAKNLVDGLDAPG